MTTGAVKETIITVSSPIENKSLKIKMVELSDSETAAAEQNLLNIKLKKRFSRLKKTLKKRSVSIL